MLLLEIELLPEKEHRIIWIVDVIIITVVVVVRIVAISWRTQAAWYALLLLANQQIRRIVMTEITVIACVIVSIIPSEWIDTGLGAL